MGRIPNPPITDPFFGRLPGVLAKYASLFKVSNNSNWTNWFTSITRQLNSFFTELDALGGLQGITGMPFNGILGDGRHGALTIGANTTATELIPIYQLTSLNVLNGFTWTAFNQQPHGFIISCTGRCTIAGSISVVGRGGAGGPTGATGVGTSGYAGYNWAGNGGGGGGATSAIGGQGGPIRSAYPMGGHDPGGFSPAIGNTQWDRSTTASTDGQLRGQSSIYNIGSASGGTAGNAGAAGTSVAAALDVTLFPTLWSFFANNVLGGFGSGGGSGGGNGGAGAGAGGNGGGYCIILCDELDFTGTINASGNNGSNTATSGCGGGGGGGGGPIIIGYRTLIANSGTLTVAGGSGGTGGAGGAAGGAGGAGYSNVFDIRR